MVVVVTALLELMIAEGAGVGGSSAVDGPV